MRFFSLLVGLLIALLGLTGIGRAVLAQDRPQLPSQRHRATVQMLQDVQLHSLPPVNTEALRSEDREQANRIGPYRYGTVVNTELSPNRHGTWEQLPNGDWIWRLRLRSAGAVSMSVAFSRFALPPGAALFVYGPDGSIVRGPYTRTDATNGQHRTPLVRGEEVIVELAVPSSRRAEVTLTIGSVVHGYRSLVPGRGAPPPSKAGACNVDVACQEANAWRDQVRSVGRYTYETGGGSFVCSGALVNTTADDKTPYFLTAEHCVSTPSEAESMVFYWNYQNPTCRAQDSSENGTVTNDDPTAQTSSGAILRFRYGSTHANGTIAGKPDLALVEVDDEIPDSYELYFSGWSRTGTAPNKSTTIHHPQGHGKRISFDQDPSSLIDYPTGGFCPDVQAPDGDTHLEIENWEVGTTEPGSSGSPLFNDNQQITGVLSGGCAGCNFPDAPDWYGRLAPGFDTGDYVPPGDSEPSTLADVLDPNDTGAQTLEGRSLSAFPPEAVSNLTLRNVPPDSVALEWTASGDDGDEGTAFAYDVRVRTGRPITSREDFLAAHPVQNVPRPEPSGTSQSVTVPVEQDTSYYFAIKVFDEALLPSEMATVGAVQLVSDLKITQPPFPNPTQGGTRLKFAVEERQTVRVTLYDALGRRLRVLFDDEVSPFRQRTVSANLSNQASGTYFVRVRGSDQVRTGQIVLVK